MIRISIFGAGGRMGKLLQSEAPEDIQIVQLLDEGDAPILSREAEIVVDFSLPGAWKSLDELLEGTSAVLVSGTTGLGPGEEALLKKWSRDRAVFYSSNMSVGIFVLGKLMKQANLMLDDSFERELIEFHHIKKADSPSGTARTLLKNWPESAGVHSVRGGDIAGEHHLHYMGQGERLVLSHMATDRRVFALGALKAVRFMHTVSKPGLYGMEDLLG